MEYWKKIMVLVIICLGVVACGGRSTKTTETETIKARDTAVTSVVLSTDITKSSEVEVQKIWDEYGKTINRMEYDSLGLNTKGINPMYTDIPDSVAYLREYYDNGALAGEGWITFFDDRETDTADKVGIWKYYTQEGRMIEHRYKTTQTELEWENALFDKMDKLKRLPLSDTTALDQWNAFAPECDGVVAEAFTDNVAALYMRDPLQFLNWIYAHSNSDNNRDLATYLFYAVRMDNFDKSRIAQDIERLDNTQAKDWLRKWLDEWDKIYAE